MVKEEEVGQKQRKKGGGGEARDKILICATGVVGIAVSGG